MIVGEMDLSEFARIDWVNIEIPPLPKRAQSQNTNLQSAFILSQNHPNPFKPTTTISYSLPRTSLVTLKIYNMIGQEIATLVNEEKTEGNYQIDFNASSLSSGVYLYKLQAGSFVQTRKMILLK